MRLGRRVAVQAIRHAQRHPGRRVEVTRGLVNLHNPARVQIELGTVSIGPQRAPQASPAVQRELMRASIVPLGGQRNLLMMTIACSIWLTVHVGEGLRMAEVTGSA